jgi:hypothetical protein
MEQEKKRGRGRPFKYTAEEMEQAFHDWIKWLDTQYIERVEYNQKLNEQFNVKIKKPPTIQSFCLFVDITTKTFYNLFNEVSEDIDYNLLHIITRIKEYIASEQIAGASVGTLNAQIIARINNLSDTVQVNQNVTVNALPINIGAKAIDLTELEYQVIENE